MTETDGFDAALAFAREMRGRRFATILADPPWRFQNRTGKMAPEHRRLSRYGTMELDEIMALPVAEVAAEPAHLYLWVPNALLPDGLAVMKSWGFDYKSNLVWHKVRKDGGSDGRGVGSISATSPSCACSACAARRRGRSRRGGGKAIWSARASANIAASRTSFTM